MDDDIKVEIIPALMLAIVARQTELDFKQIPPLSEEIERGDVVMLAVRREVEGFVDQYMGRVCLWLSPEKDARIRQAAPEAVVVLMLHVNERARLQGIATKVMQIVETVVASRDRTTIAVLVEPDNEAARKMNESLGYTLKQVDGQDTFMSDIDDDGNHVATPVAMMLMVKELS